MKQGNGGPDFTEELWQRGLVAVLWGTWKIDDIRSEVYPTRLDERKLTPRNLNVSNKALQAPRQFLFKMSPDDRVVVSFNKSLHIGIVGEGYAPDPAPENRKDGEHFKCRLLREDSPYSPKEFPLAELPAAYRLVATTGQQTIQRIRAYEPLVQLLDTCDSAKEVKAVLAEKAMEELLPMLSAKQWEILCAEYLRSTVGLKPLLAVGGTLKDIDIYGVNNNGQRILAQCKNSSNPWKSEDIETWIGNLAKAPNDILYFFSRGGIEGHVDESQCRTVTSQEVLDWLEPLEDYQRYFKVL